MAGEARQILRAEMVRQGYSFNRLAEALAEQQGGMPIESVQSLTNKVNRGAVFVRVLLAGGQSDGRGVTGFDCGRSSSSASAGGEVNTGRRPSQKVSHCECEVDSPPCRLAALPSQRLRAMDQAGAGRDARVRRGRCVGLSLTSAHYRIAAYPFNLS
jgi:Domain of unknown function (DUF6471)